MGKVQMILQSSEFEEKKSHYLIKNATVKSFFLKIYRKYYTLFIDKVFHS